MVLKETIKQVTSTIKQKDTIPKSVLRSNYQGTTAEFGILGPE